MVLLVADDESFIRRGIVSLDWGALGISKVLEAANGLEAKALLEKEAVDIVVSDIRMPGLNGLDIAEYIYKSSWDTKVILLTGFSDFEYAKQAIKSQVFEYLLKPVVPEELFKAVKAAMDQLSQQKYEARIVGEYEAKTGSFKTTEQILHSFRHLDAQALDILKYMAGNFEKDLSLTALSRIYHLSPVYLSRYIKKETGYSFVDILTCIRLLNALAHLRDGSERVQIICERTGFKDQRYFSQIFRRLIGCRPVEYRKNKNYQRNFTIIDLLSMKAQGLEK